MAKLKRRTKSCKGCGDHFITLKNYDYCVDCAINNNRYATKSPCSECDGSGIIKFRGQKPRSCKLCYLTKKTMRIIKPKNKNTKPYDSDKNLSFWDQVDQQTHYLIADLLNQVLPLANCRDKKVFDPNEDADYRTIGAEVENDYEDNLPNQEKVSEEIAYEYLFLVVKSLIGKLRSFNCHREEYLTKLF